MKIAKKVAVVGGPANERKAIHYAMAWANHYKPQGRDMTEFAADMQTTNSEAERLVNEGNRILN